MAEKINNNNIFDKIPVVNGLLIIFQVIIIMFKRSLLPDRVPLFYSRPWGAEQLAPRNYLFLLPVISLLILLLVLIAGHWLFQDKEKIVGKISEGFSLLFSLLATITIFKIVFLIT